MDAQTITLGGVDYSVAPFVLRQNVAFQGVVGPILAKVTTASVSDLDGDDADTLVKIAVIATSRLSPAPTREFLEDQPITIPELVAALLVAMKQSGLWREKAASPGEGEGPQSP